MIVFNNTSFMMFFLFLEILLLSVLLLFCIKFFLLIGVSGVLIFFICAVCLGGFGISLAVRSTRFGGVDFVPFKFIFQDGFYSIIDVQLIYWVF